MPAKWNIAGSPDGQQQIEIENKMLKFLQGKQSNSLAVKPLLKYQPELVYGHTEQSPHHFLNRHTIYFNSAQQSAFLKKTNQAQLPSVHHHDKQTLRPAFRHSSEQFIIDSHYRKDQTGEKPIKDKRERGAGVSGDFNITRGQFSNFLDKHKHYRSIGTLHKQNKTDFSATHTQSMHRITWNKSIHTDSKSMPTNSIIKSKMSLPSETVDVDRSILNNSKQSAFGLTRSNSVSIFEKAVKKSELKLRRDEFVGLMRKETKERLWKKYETFGLPRLGVEHQLFLLQKTKASKRQPVSQLQQMNSDIDKFQQSLYYKFK